MSSPEAPAEVWSATHSLDRVPQFMPWSRDVEAAHMAPLDAYALFPQVLARWGRRAWSCRAALPVVWYSVQAWQLP
jgi:hypothetical protein